MPQDTVLQCFYQKWTLAPSHKQMKRRRDPLQDPVVEDYAAKRLALHGAPLLKLGKHCLQRKQFGAGDARL